jgi:hypothetical protein
MLYFDAKQTRAISIALRVMGPASKGWAWAISVAAERNDW